MSYLTLFWEYFKIGLFTIGGGYAMLPLVTQVVLQRQWLTQEQLVSFVGIAEATPGPFAINLATFVGLNVGASANMGFLGSLLGAVIATVAVVLPSLVIIILVSKAFAKFNNSAVVKGALQGVRPVVVGLILSAVVSVCCQLVLPNLNLTNVTRQGFEQFDYVSLLLVVAFIALHNVKVKGKRVHPIALILLSAVLGVILFGVFGLGQ